MSMDIKFIEAMVSRICHDLISPISAVTNGTELVADLGTIDVNDEAFGLIRDSAQAASIKLQSFRLAYGAGGSEWHVSIGDVEKCFSDYVGLEKRCTLEWHVSKDNLPQPLKRGLPKLVMLGLMWAVECMPRGGKIIIDVARMGEEAAKFKIVANGEGAGLRDGARQAFDGILADEQISPKVIHAAAVGYYANSYGVTVDVHESDDNVTFSVQG